jgi:putative endonuclease
MEKGYVVYILANASRRIYVGSTSNLIGRLRQHRQKTFPGFTRDHNITMLVYYEEIPDPAAMVARERDMKSWRRERKVELIEQENPLWFDLSAGWDV